MDLKQLEHEFEMLGEKIVTKDIDRLNKRLIKEKVDVSFLKDIVLENQRYHRTYFQVSLGQMKTIEEQFEFIEDNFHNLNDWWHVDQLTQFIKPIPLDYAYNKAKEYVNHPWSFARRWGYVLFMPVLCKNIEAFDLITSLFHNDLEYYVVMAEAWLISYLGIYFPAQTEKYLSKCKLDYSIVGKAIQKICDSFRINDEWKIRFKELRKKYK